MAIGMEALEGLSRPPSSSPLSPLVLNSASAKQHEQVDGAAESARRRRRRSELEKEKGAVENEKENGACQNNSTGSGELVRAF